MKEFNTKDDFIEWYKQIISDDIYILNHKNIPSVHTEGILWTDIQIVNDYHKLSKKEQLKHCDKEVISRLETIRKNLTINLQHFNDINGRINKELTPINDLIYNLSDGYKQLEPYHFYTFLHAVEQIQFFIKSKMMSYDTNSLFTIPKDKYDRAIERLQEKVDVVQFFFDDELIDNQMRVRIPLNPKITVSQMILALKFQGDKDNTLAKHFCVHIIGYFNKNSNGIKFKGTDLFNTFYLESKSFYGMKKENLLYDTLYFYKPSIKLNYKS